MFDIQYDIHVHEHLSYFIHADEYAQFWLNFV